jgi:hypothetical protein
MATLILDLGSHYTKLGEGVGVGGWGLGFSCRLEGFRDQNYCSSLFHFDTPGLLLSPSFWQDYFVSVELENLRDTYYSYILPVCEVRRTRLSGPHEMVCVEIMLTTVNTPAFHYFQGLLNFFSFLPLKWEQLLQFWTFATLLTASTPEHRHGFWLLRTAKPVCVNCCAIMPWVEGFSLSLGFRCCWQPLKGGTLSSVNVRKLRVKAVVL